MRRFLPKFVKNFLAKLDQKRILEGEAKKAETK